MEAHLHLVVILAGCLGFMLGGFLIDLDHSGTIKDKWNCFTTPKLCDESKMERGILHKPIVAFSIIIFCYALATGYLIHLLMDIFWNFR